jgi:Tol biopolymer transport system component
MRNYSSPRAAPDGSKIAVEVAGQEGHVHLWIMDARSGAATQLTFDGDEDRYPVWTADSREVIYTSRRGKEYALWRKNADGTGIARHVLDGSDALVADDVHGHTLIYQERGAGGNQRDLFTLDLDTPGPGHPLLATPDDEVGGRVSPDGRWIAYVLTPKNGGTSNRRVYVRPFPDAASGGQRAVSDGQGAGVEWSPAGDEILYSVNGMNSTPLMAVPVTTTATTLTPGAPRQLFMLGDRVLFTQTGTTLPFGYTYGVLPGAKDFIGVAAASASTSPAGDASSTNQPHFNVVLNWTEELKKLVPTD